MAVLEGAGVRVIVGLARRGPIQSLEGGELLLDGIDDPDHSVVVAYLRGKLHNARGERAEATPLFQSVVSPDLHHAAHVLLTAAGASAPPPRRLGF